MPPKAVADAVQDDDGPSVMQASDSAVVTEGAGHGGAVASEPTAESLVVPLLEERGTVSTREVVTGTVRVVTSTDIYEATAEVDLDRYRVEVERVLVGRVVDSVPAVRTAGDTTIVSIVEERLVTIKQLVLTEELHIRRVVEREAVHETVSLRRQSATVERRDAAGRLAIEPN